MRGTAIEGPLSPGKGLAARAWPARWKSRAPELAPGLRLFGFTDAGQLWNNDPDGLPKLSGDRLASVGAGLRFSRGPVVASVEYGRLVTGCEVSRALNTAAPERGDDRAYVNLGIRF